MVIGNREFKDRTYVMGILNVTPDSFSDGSKYNTLDRALKHTEEMIKDGMDIVDVGGESTRPGYTMISDEEEISRVVPVVEKIRLNLIFQFLLILINLVLQRLLLMLVQT